MQNRFSARRPPIYALLPARHWPLISPFPSRSRRTTAQDKPEGKTPEAGATPSPGSLLHDGDLLIGQPVKLVNQGVDLPVRRLYLPRKEGLLVAKSIDSESRMTKASI